MRTNSLSVAVSASALLLAAFLFGLLTWTVYGPQSVHEQPEPGLARYALVIGAAQYRSLSARPDYVRQARAVARHAEESGYALIGGAPLLNPTEHELRRAVNTLGRLSENGAEAFFYFAGHAVPGDNTIFLLAIDSEPPPMVRYAEGGMRIDEAWSHPVGIGPSRTVVVIETAGVGGLFGPHLSGAGTGFEVLDVPESVIVAVSDRGGPITIQGEAFHRTGRAPPRLMFATGEGEVTGQVLFTDVLIELELLAGDDPSQLLDLISLHVHERSSGQLTPVVFDRSRAVMPPPVRNGVPGLAPAEGPGILEDIPGIDADVLPDRVLAELLLGAGREAAGLPAELALTGQSVIELIQMFEAFRAETYLDAAGINTIGYGHTGHEASAGNVITHERAIELLMEDIDIAAGAVDAAVIRPLTDNQRNALISLVFNIGGQAFSDSTLVRLINGDIHAVSAPQFLRWIHARAPNGTMRALRGLESRRQLEAFLFLVEEGSVTAHELILIFEPFRPDATRVRGCSLIGYGRALDPCEEEFDARISRVEALQYLRRELVQVETEIQAVIEVPLSEGQMASLVSFVHQNGMDVFERSRILVRLNQADYTGAANALRLHDAFNGESAMQLGESQIERRAAEAALFFAHGGDYVSAVPEVSLMTRVLIIFLSLMITGAVFLIESWTPLAFAHGLLYILPLILLRHEHLAFQAGLAVLASVLVVLGYFGSPPGYADEFVVLNRGLSILAVWAIVIIQADGRAAYLANSPRGRAPSSKAPEEPV